MAKIQKKSLFFKKIPVIYNQIEIVLHLETNLKSSCINKNNNLNIFVNGRRPQLFCKWNKTLFFCKWKKTLFFCKWKVTSSPSTYKKIRSSSIYKIIEVVFHSQKYLGRLPFTKKIRAVFNLQKKLRSSSIHKKM